jgi:hypothetical protein
MRHKDAEEAWRDIVNIMSENVPWNVRYAAYLGEHEFTIPWQEKYRPLRTNHCEDMAETLYLPKIS